MPAEKPSLVDRLDPASRRTLRRLIVESLLLVIVLGLVYGKPLMQTATGGPRATPTPAPAGPALGISSAEIVDLFRSGRVGGFEFQLAAAEGGLDHVVGVSTDGASSLDLLGAPTDLSRVTLSLQVPQPGVLADSQRAQLAVLLAFFAPAALSPVLDEVQTALGAGRDGAFTHQDGQLAVRIAVNRDPGDVVVTLIRADVP